MLEPSDGEVQPEPLRVETHCPDPDTIVVTPSGEADVSTVSLLRRTLGDAIDTGRPRLVVDLDQLTFMDSATLNLLVEARHRVAATGGSFSVRSRNRLGRLLLKTVRLDFLLERDG